MARNADEIVRDTLGNLTLQIVQLTAALEKAEERIKQLEEAEKA